MRTAIAIGYWKGKYRRVYGFDGEINRVKGMISDRIANQEDFPMCLTMVAIRLPKKLGLNHYTCGSPTIESRYHSNGQRNRNVY